MQTFPHGLISKVLTLNSTITVFAAINRDQDYLSSCLHLVKWLVNICGVISLAAGLAQAPPYHPPQTNQKYRYECLAFDVLVRFLECCVCCQFLFIMSNVRKILIAVDGSHFFDNAFDCKCLDGECFCPEVGCQCTSLVLCMFPARSICSCKKSSSKDRGIWAA